MSLSFYSNLESFLVFFLTTQLISLQVDQQKMDQADFAFMWWMHLKKTQFLIWTQRSWKSEKSFQVLQFAVFFIPYQRQHTCVVSFWGQNYSQCSICALLTSGHTVLSIFEPIACYLSGESLQIYNSMAKGEANSEPVVLTIHRVSGPWRRLELESPLWQ